MYKYSAVEAVSERSFQVSGFMQLDPPPKAPSGDVDVGWYHEAPQPGATRARWLRFTSLTETEGFVGPASLVAPSRITLCSGTEPHLNRNR